MGVGGVSHNFGLKVVDTQILVNRMSCQFGFETESGYEFIIEVPNNYLSLKILVSFSYQS